VNFPFICSNIPEAPAHGVYISQLIRFSRVCGSYQDFLDRVLLLTRKLLNQGLLLFKLKFYDRHHDLVEMFHTLIVIYQPLPRMDCIFHISHTTLELAVFADFSKRNRLLRIKLLNQEFLKNRFILSFKKFFDTLLKSIPMTKDGWRLPIYFSIVFSDSLVYYLIFKWWLSRADLCYTTYPYGNLCFARSNYIICGVRVQDWDSEFSTPKLLNYLHICGVGILLTSGQHWYDCIISLRREGP
jgi:hypothetical protein